MHVASVDLQRFVSWTEIVPGECWPWQGARDKDGYGFFRLNGKQHRAHRVAWSIAKGEDIPKGMQILHRCDNPPCVKPSHLFLGTVQDNKDDEVAKGRHVHLDRHPNAKLTREAVVEIRRRRADGERVADIAKDFSVTAGAVHNVLSGLTWSKAT